MQNMTIRLTARFALIALCGLVSIMLRPPVAAAASSSTACVVEDGVALGQLYLPASSGLATQFAAQELREHLRKMTGADFERAWRVKGPKDSGFVLAVRPASEWKGKESSQAFSIEEAVAPHPIVKIVGNTDLAVLYGVYEYLGGLGMRWLTPGDIGTNTPRMSDIAIRPGKRHSTPSFLSRALGLSSTSRNHFGGTGVNSAKAITDYQLFLVRNRVHLGRHFQDRFGFNKYGTASGHAVKPMTGLTRSKVAEGYMKTAPERFALVTGSDFVQKRRYEGGQVCFTNKENIQTAIANCVAHFEKLAATKEVRGSDLDEDHTVPMGLSDCRGICECAQCAKVAGKEPYSKDRLVWHFWNRVARGLNDRLPGRIMAVYSPYMDLTQPPADVAIEPNIMVVTPLVFSWDKASADGESYRFPKTFLRSITRTRQAGATLGCYNYLNFPWSPTPLHILDAAQRYAELGYKHYHLEAMQRTEYTWPIIWALAQFTWDSSRSPRDYLEEFCREYYGAPYNADVLWILDDMTRNACAMERINFGSAADTSTMLPDAHISHARGKLRNALRGAQGSRRERLRRFQISIEAQFQLAETYRAFCRALNHRTAEDIQAFSKRAHGLKTFWRKNDLEAISTTARTPEAAAGLFLKTDFDSLKPVTRKGLAGKGPGDERWMQELFAGSAPPAKTPNLFALPEVWTFSLDSHNRGLKAGYFKTDHDDSTGWQPISSWNFPSRQGYGPQIGGYFWYRLRFQAPKFPGGKRVFLRIGSLDDSGDVYLNGVKVGSQPSPYAWDKSFAMDVTNVIKPGAANVLAVYGYDGGGGEGVWRPSALYTD